MDPRFHNSSDRAGPRFEITYPNGDGNSFQEPSNEGASSTCTSSTDVCGLSSDGILKYIDQILMEDEDTNTNSLHESFDFQAKERSFYELLGQNYPPAPPQGSPLVPMDDLDDVLVYALDKRDDKLAAYISDLRITGTTANGEGPSSSVRVKKPRTENSFVDLGSLLNDCALSVAATDHPTTTKLLTQIRQHSSPSGSWTQRLAHYFANGIEVRLAGTGRAPTYARMGTANPSDYLKAYCMFLVSSSFNRISSFASSKSILIKSGKAKRVHVIDFGILRGFQWPAFIHRLSKREGGPPKLRITGIDFLQTAEIILDTGRHLAHYAKILNVPFEYRAIAWNWEAIKVEDLKIEEGEFVAVNCSYRAHNLSDDDKGVGESPRNMVLDVIRKIKPDIFVHGIVNGAFNKPFFIHRFREAFHHFSGLFDMIGTIIPEESPVRMLIEREVFGKQVTNVIACEGRERVERPETYKIWRARHLRAGLTQVPFERKLMSTISCKVRECYHRDCLVVEEDQWLLMSWKGRIICALSCWKPL